MFGNRFHQPRPLFPAEKLPGIVGILGIVQAALGFLLFVVGLAYAGTFNSYERPAALVRIALNSHANVVNTTGVIDLHLYDIACIITGLVGLVSGLSSIGGIMLGNKSMVNTGFALAFVSALNCAVLFFYDAMIINEFMREMVVGGYDTRRDDRQFGTPQPQIPSKVYAISQVETFQPAVVFMSLIFSFFLSLVCLVSTFAVCSLWSTPDFAGMPIHPIPVPQPIIGDPMHPPPPGQPMPPPPMPDIPPM